MKKRGNGKSLNSWLPAACSRVWPGIFIAPDQQSSEHAREYQLSLIRTQKPAWSTYNQIMTALGFFYTRSLQRVDGLLSLPDYNAWLIVQNAESLTEPMTLQGQSGRER